MIESLEIFSKPSCSFCINLKFVIDKLVDNNLLTCDIIYLDANPNESVPYIVKYSTNSQPQTLYGLPVREKLYRFLEINDPHGTSAIYPNATRKNKKVFKVD